jgi:hypothetical protein
MPNTSNWTYADHTPVYKVQGYMTNKEGLLVQDVKVLKGLAPFGVNVGILTEDELTEPIVEWLLSKKDENGNQIYAEFLIKKNKFNNDKNK